MTKGEWRPKDRVSIRPMCLSTVKWHLNPNLSVCENQNIEPLHKQSFIHHLMYTNDHTLKRYFLVRSHWRQWDWDPVTRMFPVLLQTRTILICIGILDLTVTSSSERWCQEWQQPGLQWSRWSSQSSGMGVRQRVKPGPCILEEQTLSSSRRSVGSPGKLPSRTREQNRASTSLRISPKREERA